MEAGSACVIKVENITLTVQDQKKISDKVQEIESTTSAEILPFIVAKSDDYPGASWRCAVSFLFLATILWFFYPSEHHIDSLLLSQILGLTFGYFLSHFSPVKRLYLRSQKLDEEVHQKALEIFLSSGLTETSDRRGVLLFISLLEHRVEIITDVGVAQKIKNQEWDQVIQEFSLQIKNKNFLEGVLGAIEGIGKKLAPFFPPDPSKKNQIPNQIQTS